MVPAPAMIALELETVELNVTDRVAWITLNRPQALNAWTGQLANELRTALDHAAEDPDIRVIVLTGAGRAFSSGADLKAGGAGDESASVSDRLRTLYNPLMIRVRTIPKPVVAAVNGPAVGIGCSLALCCDLIVAAESAYFLLAFVNIGLVPDGGSSLFLPTRIGMARATELSMLGERLPAPKALEWGLINRVVGDDQLRAEGEALAARLAAGPTKSYAGAKRQLNNWLYSRMPEQLELEARVQQEM